MLAKAIILIYITSNSHPNFGNLLEGMLIFKQFKTILKSIFHFLLELQFISEENVSKMLTDIAKGQLLDTRGQITVLQYQITQPHSFSLFRLWVAIKVATYQ